MVIAHDFGNYLGVYFLGVLALSIIVRIIRPTLNRIIDISNRSEKIATIIVLWPVLFPLISLSLILFFLMKIWEDVIILAVWLIAGEDK